MHGCAVRISGQRISRCLHRQVSATTGIGRSTIYRQFGNKEGLFRFIVARKIDQVRTETIDSSGGTHFEQRVENLARNALDAHLEPQSIAMHQLLIQEAIEFPISRNPITMLWSYEPGFHLGGLLRNGEIWLPQKRSFAHSTRSPHLAFGISLRWIQ
ncbi:TetR family transcriptional regulator (plasmid) [Sphingomonas paeninsulae]|uniref:TetR family transcriptional regulator n=1 Tax=Sphingomonas paeninsulae TaxID=2319844 RepID=A0A494TFW0_SPHPE|nr:TetR family transcriptional regulator [Sphingomonas paeninsulae]